MSRFLKIFKKPALYRQIRRNSVYKQSCLSLFLYDLSKELKWKCLFDSVQMYWRKGIIKYLSKYFDKTDSYKNRNVKGVSDNIIWVCWFQGESEAPDLVKSCIMSIKKNAGNNKVVVLTDENISDYVDIPDYIYEKVRTGVITRTHFSDILRLALLNRYGGLWLDATIFVSGAIPVDIFSYDFWSIRDDGYKYGNYGSLYRWTAFCMSAKPNNVLIRRSLQVLYNYWAKENGFVHYFIIDYVMSLVCENDFMANNQVNKIKPSNYHLHGLQLNANKEYSLELYKTIFHKLSYKISLSDDPNTLFNRIIKYKETIDEE